MLGVSSTNQIVSQIDHDNLTAIVGELLPPNVWAHLVITYSAVNAVRLWINGKIVENSTAFTHLQLPIPNQLILGTLRTNSTACARETIDEGQFYGVMDELQVFS